jgi:hypothetical protein
MPSVELVAAIMQEHRSLEAAPQNRLKVRRRPPTPPALPTRQYWKQPSALRPNARP